MEQSVLKKLEYYLIIEQLSDLAISEMGKQAAFELTPQTAMAQVNLLLEQTGEALYALGHVGRNPVDSFADIRIELQKSKAASLLNMAELLSVAKTCRAIRLCKESLSKDQIGEKLRQMANMLPTFRHVEEEIFRCIISEEEMADHASSALLSLRKQIRTANARVREKLNQMVHSNAYKTYLQDSIITVRNGRYVLPVRAEHRAQVPGLVHDQSGSGMTLFIEPMSVVEIGNELKKIQSQELEEIERILQAITMQIAPYADEVIGAMQLLAQIDLIFAKACLAQKMNAIIPKINNIGFIRIVAGRHPLIDPQVVVPIDLWLGNDFRTLIITGPNTGGKTVTLKTVGLFTAMAQSGLFLPAKQGIEIAVFERIFADIGDEQSIEQSLSTFSSHMKNLVHLLQFSDDRSLVLLDELGSGTDPIEGAALAMAILQELHGRKCTTLATTHYSELKGFALTREGMENASMEFDLQTLKPTYRLFVGIPGKSNAFEISRKLGLSDRIIESAQNFLQHEDVRFEDIISSAHSQKQIAEQERMLAQQAREELTNLRKKAEEERVALLQQREKILQKARTEAQSLVQKTKRESEAVIAELKKTSDLATQSERSRAIQQARDAIRGQESEHRGTISQEAVDYGQPLKSVQAGEEVFVTSLDQNAVVLAPANKGEVLIQAGILKVTVKLVDLRAKTSNRQQKKKENKQLNLSMRSIGMEIDVRGQSVEEAIMEVDHYLDEASLCALQEVQIIHGKGTGLLRAGIHDFLKRNRHVSNFRLGKYGEGESGVTVVTLKN